MGWSDGMENDAELEEGEAPYYMDGRSFDPDTDLSYLSYIVRVLYCSCCVDLFRFLASLLINQLLSVSFTEEGTWNSSTWLKV